MPSPALVNIVKLAEEVLRSCVGGSIDSAATGRLTSDSSSMDGKLCRRTTVGVGMRTLCYAHTRRMVRIGCRRRPLSTAVNVQPVIATSVRRP